MSRICDQVGEERVEVIYSVDGIVVPHSKAFDLLLQVGVMLCCQVCCCCLHANDDFNLVCSSAAVSWCRCTYNNSSMLRRVLNSSKYVGVQGLYQQNMPTACLVCLIMPHHCCFGPHTLCKLTCLFMLLPLLVLLWVSRTKMLSLLLLLLGHQYGTAY